MTHDETVEREKAKAVGHLLDMWEQYPNDERSCLMDPLRDALNSLMRAYEARAALSAIPRADDGLEGLRELSEALNAHEAVSDELCEGSDWMDYAGWEERKNVRLDAAKDAVIDAAVNYVRARLSAQAGSSPCKNCFGSGQLADPEVGGEDGYYECPFCKGTGRLAQAGER